MTMTMSVCTEPPSKKDFLNALFFIAQPTVGQDFDAPMYGDGPTLRWI